MNKVINISSNGIKQAIDDLVNENEMLQDKVYKLEDVIKEAREYIEDNTYKAYETEYMDLTGIKELLEILDKVEEK